MSSHSIKVTVQRGPSQSHEVHTDTFDVPAHESQTVLDVVSWIQQNADPTLSYRFACRVGMCGSCAMMVNGVPRWTCRTHMSKVLKGNAVEIAPLRNLPVIKDLVTDMDPFFDKWVAAEGVHHHRVYQLLGLLRGLRHSCGQQRLSWPCGTATSVDTT